MQLIKGDVEYFKGINTICYEGPDSPNPLAFRWYDADKYVAGKPMKDWLRFACAYWHSFVGNGSDPFGEPTHLYPWNEHPEPVERAKKKMDAAFELMTKLQIPFYCFHDVDMVDLTSDLVENERRMHLLTDYAWQKQQASGVKLLWGTANLFSHRRYMNGAATNPDFTVVSFAAAQVKGALDATIRLGGENYVFWGGREGYMTLLNTQMKREIDHLARFLHLCKDYARHTFQHELQVAADAGVLGSIDANRGDYQNGWDTDQFPTNLYELIEAMLVIVPAGGFAGGGINFDAKRRRNSTDPVDLFHAHIGGMDSFARALLIADKILSQSDYSAVRQKRYASFDTGKGKEFEEGKLTLEALADLATQYGEPSIISGRQEYLENLINRFI